MPNGIVKFFNAAKGFGFITPDEGDKEIFFPAASIPPASVSSLKAGQRVAFETQAEARGPKAINLTLLAMPDPPKIVKQYVQQPAKVEQRARLTFYHDPESDKSCDALEELRAAGHEPRIVEYLSAPLTRDELRALSMLLRDSNQTLVRKYDPLFLELRLDDRFIGDNEFWDAIVENPSLINGPIAATASKASVCKSEQAVQSFLLSISSNSGPVPPKPKNLSERALQLMNGDAAPRPVAQENAPETIEKKTAEKIEAKVEPKPAPEVEAKIETKAKLITAEKPKAKVAVKTEKPAAKAKLAAKPVAKAKTASPAKKPVKKAVRK